MKNQSFETWCQNAKNYQDNLKIVMFDGVKVPVKNFMCPICNSKKAIQAINDASLADPDAKEESTQLAIHACHGWNAGINLAIWKNVVYHHPCLEKKLGVAKFKKLVTKGDILSE